MSGGWGRGERREGRKEEEKRKKKEKNSVYGIFPA